MRDRSADELEIREINMKGFLFDLENCNISMKKSGGSRPTDFVEVVKRSKLYIVGKVEFQESINEGRDMVSELNIINSAGKKLKNMLKRLQYNDLLLQYAVYAA